MAPTKRHVAIKDFMKYLSIIVAAHGSWLIVVTINYNVITSLIGPNFICLNRPSNFGLVVDILK